MRFDYENMYSGEGPATVGGAVQGQAITASAASTNLIDHGAPGPGPRLMDGRVYVQVIELFATLTSLTVTLQSDNDVAFGSPTALLNTGAITLASGGLAIGKVLLDVGGIRVRERYTRLLYTVGGSNATAGRVVAGLVHGVQDGYGQR